MVKRNMQQQENEKLKQQIELLSDLISRAKRQNEITAELKKLKSQIDTSQQKPKKSVLPHGRAQTAVSSGANDAEKNCRKTLLLHGNAQRSKNSTSSNGAGHSQKTHILIKVTEPRVSDSLLSSAKEGNCDNSKPSVILEMKGLKSWNPVPSNISAQTLQNINISPKTPTDFELHVSPHAKDKMPHHLSVHKANPNGVKLCIESTVAKPRNPEQIEIGESIQSNCIFNKQKTKMKNNLEDNSNSDVKSPSKAESLRSKYSFMRKKITGKIDNSFDISRSIPFSKTDESQDVSHNQPNLGTSKSLNDDQVSLTENSEKEMQSSHSSQNSPTKNFDVSKRPSRNESQTDTTSIKTTEKIKEEKVAKLKLELERAEAKLQILKGSLQNTSTVLSSVPKTVSDSPVLDFSNKMLNSNFDQNVSTCKLSPYKFAKEMNNSGKNYSVIHNLNSNSRPKKNSSENSVISNEERDKLNSEQKKVNSSNMMKDATKHRKPREKTETIEVGNNIIVSSRNESNIRDTKDVAHIMPRSFENIPSDKANILVRSVLYASYNRNKTCQTERKAQKVKVGHQDIPLITATSKVSEQSRKGGVQNQCKNTDTINDSTNLIRSKVTVCKELCERLDSLKRRRMLIKSNEKHFEKVFNKDRKYDESQTKEAVDAGRNYTIKGTDRVELGNTTQLNTRYKLTRQTVTSCEDRSVVDGIHKSHTDNPVSACIEMPLIQSDDTSSSYVCDKHNSRTVKSQQNKKTVLIQNTRYRLCKNNNPRSLVFRKAECESAKSLGPRNLNMPTCLANKILHSRYKFRKKTLVDKYVAPRDQKLAKSKALHSLQTPISITRYSVCRTRPKQHLIEVAERASLTSSLSNSADRWNRHYISQTAAKLIVGKYKLKRLQHRLDDRYAYHQKQVETDKLVEWRHQQNDRYKYYSAKNSNLSSFSNKPSSFHRYMYAPYASNKRSDFRRQMSTRVFSQYTVPYYYRRRRSGMCMAWKKPFSPHHYHFVRRPHNNKIARKYHWDSTNRYLQNNKRYLQKRLQNLQERCFLRRNMKTDHRKSLSYKHHSIPDSKARLVLLNGMLYKSSQQKLEKTILQKEVISKKRTPQDKNFTVKKLCPRGVKTVIVRGVKFKVDNNGKTLRRTTQSSPSKNIGHSMPESCSSISRADIGGVTYIQTKPGTLVQVGSSQKRALANRVVSKSIAFVSSRHKLKVKQYCMFYNRFGKCNRGDKCQYIHDPDKVAVCTRFLRGTCKVTDCLFSHKIDKEKMPVCSFFLKGTCCKEDCPYLHVKVNKHADVCQEFIKGYCPLGQKCKKKHTLVCPTFSETGVCPKGKSCHLKHKVKNTRLSGTSLKLKGDLKFTSTPIPAAKAAKRKVADSSTGDEPDIPFKQQKLPAFISLQTNLSENCEVLPDVSKDEIVVNATDTSLHIVPRL